MTFLLGQADNEEKARGLVTHFRDPANVEAAFQETRQWWNRLLSTIEVETPELSTNFLLNRWLLYQTLSCRVWGRSALYQSSGAYGFRDQLQDVMALVHSVPQLARDHILRAAARQFVGSVTIFSGFPLSPRITFAPPATPQYSISWFPSSTKNRWRNNRPRAFPFRPLPPRKVLCSNIVGGQSRAPPQPALMACL
jgi:hypothetical protein